LNIVSERNELLELVFRRRISSLNWTALTTNSLKTGKKLLETERANLKDR